MGHVRAHSLNIICTYNTSVCAARRSSGEAAGRRSTRRSQCSMCVCVCVCLAHAIDWKCANAVVRATTSRRSSARASSCLAVHERRRYTPCALATCMRQRASCPWHMLRTNKRCDTRRRRRRRRTQNDDDMCVLVFECAYVRKNRSDSNENLNVCVCVCACVRVCQIACAYNRERPPKG